MKKTKKKSTKVSTASTDSATLETVSYSHKRKSKDLPTKVIEIPHLKFRVLIKDMEAYKKLYPDNEIKGGAVTLRTDTHEITIFITDMAKSTLLIENTPLIAHECMHVIQLISTQYGMSIEHEMEHSAYLMYYLIEEIIN